MAEPKTIQAGASSTWKRTISSDYASGDGYATEYVLTSGEDQITIAAAQAVLDNLEITVTLTPSITNQWAPGKYRWFLYAYKSGERWPLASGYVEVLANPASGNYDFRSHARKCLDAIKAMLENKTLSDDASSLSIQTGNGSRSITRLTFEELITARDRYQREVDMEEAAQQLADTGNSGRRILTRFV